jgi:hypothetical protein
MEPVTFYIDTPRAQSLERGAASFREAVEAVSGVAPCLADGATYVVRLRDPSH